MSVVSHYYFWRWPLLNCAVLLLVLLFFPSKGSVKNFPYERSFNTIKIIFGLELCWYDV